MINGLWSVEFSSGLGETPGGVVIFQKGRVYGGDSGYFYDGNYITEGDIISIKVEAATYNQATNVIFGHLRNFTLILNGRMQYPVMELTGRLSAKPQMKIFANFTKQVSM